MMHERRSPSSWLYLSARSILSQTLLRLSVVGASFRGLMLLAAASEHSGIGKNRSSYYYSKSIDLQSLFIIVDRVELYPGGIEQKTWLHISLSLNRFSSSIVNRQVSRTYQLLLPPIVCRADECPIDGASPEPSCSAKTNSAVNEC